MPLTKGEMIYRNYGAPRYFSYGSILGAFFAILVRFVTPKTMKFHFLEVGLLLEEVQYYKV